MVALPTVSMVVPVYNGGEHYPVCFESLCRLDYPPDRLEVHIIDDGSTDGTGAFLQAQDPPPYIHIHRLETNRGRGPARNHGLARATGEVVIFLDGDMEIAPDFVLAHIAELARPGREATIGAVVAANWVPRTKLNRYLYDYPRRGAQQFGPDKPIGFQFLLSGNMALSRAAIEGAGGKFESFTHYGGEDTSFAYRVARTFPNGIYYTDKPVAVHHEHRSLGAYLINLTNYGRHNLPLIVTRHPEIASPLAADFAWPLPGRYFRRKRIVGRFLFNRLSDLLARALLLFTPAPLSHALMRFLSVASVVRGLRRHVQDHRPQVPHPGASRKSPAGPTAPKPAR